MISRDPIAPESSTCLKFNRSRFQIATNSNLERFCPERLQVPESGAVLDFPTLLAIEGGARLKEPLIASQMVKIFGGQILTSAPVEDVLQLSSSFCIDTILWHALERAQNCGNLDLILMGQSFGVAIARALALRLDAIGISAQGLIALDCRCAERQVLQVEPVPHALRQNMTASHWRCIVDEFHFVAPRIPRMGITARHFHPRMKLDAEMSVVSAQACASYFSDTDHFDIPKSHCWDI